MRGLRLTCIVVVAAMTVAAPRAEATVIPPGGAVPAAGIAFPGGTELDSVYYANQTAADLTASVASSVYRSTGGTLDFYYQVTNNSPAPTFDEVHRLTGSSFAGFITDVWFIINGAAVANTAAPGGTFLTGTADPFTIDRSGTGSVVGFNFPSPGFDVDAGETSLVLLVRTNAPLYAPGFVSVINSGTLTRAAFEPAVPEPASLALFGVGLLAAARRRHRTA